MLMEDQRIQVLTDQFNTLLLVLERPVVQRQITAFMIVWLLAWLLPMLVRQVALMIERRYLHLLEHEGDASITWQIQLLRWSRAVHVFWLLLGYRVLIGLFYGFLEASRADHYQRRFLWPLFLILLVILLSNSLAGTFPVGDIELITLLERPITPRRLFAALVSLYFFLTLAWLVRKLLKRFILPRTGADPGVTNTILLSTHYAIVAIGLLTTISALGFDLSALAIIGGGLSVGLGFGMQELVGNFVSGILLLFEQTLRPGDVIEVGGSRGVVDQLRMRATVVRTADNVEILIPNKSLLTSTVATYTQSARTIRRTIRVSVGFQSDPTQVRDVLTSVAERHGVVLKKPAPDVFFIGFGPTGLEFELAFWLDDPGAALKVTSDLNFMIWREFAKYKIELPNQQQDIHLRSGIPWENILKHNTADTKPPAEKPARPNLPG
jgi:potassium efflux system protein